MKAHLPDMLLRLTAIAATVMTLMAAMMPSVYVSAAPVQGDGYWQDTFSDSTGILTFTNISVSGGDVKLILGSSNSTYNYMGVTRATNNHYAYYSREPDLSLPPALTTVTEATDAQYTSIRALDTSRWTTSSPGNNKYPFTELVQYINESRDKITQFNLSWYGCSAQTTGNFSIWLYNNTTSSWEQCNNQSISQSTDTWLNYSATSSASNYISSSGNITWGVILHKTRGNSNGYTMRTNYVQASVTYNTYYSTSGSLNSVSITPSILQSWGTFNATDNNPTFCLPYRKPISITGTGTALTDYQVSVPVTYVAGKMNSDFSDLRFKDSSGNILSYWIESYVASSSAQVWVKVPSIAASGNTTIYMYYGSSTTSSASNGADTFIFFDDFSGDLSKWNTHVALGTVGINTSVGYPAPCLEIGGGSTSGNYGFTAIGTDASYSTFQDGIIEADIYPAMNALPEIIFRGVYASNTGYKGRWDCRSGNETPWMTYPYNGWAGFGTEVPRFGLVDQWQKAKLVINGTTFSIYSNGALRSTVTDATYSGPGEIGVANHYGSYVLIDNIRVRKYASLEPTINTSSEESGSYCGFSNLNAVTSITYKILNAADDTVLCTITAAQAAAGYDISSCTGATSSIKLRAELSTSNASQTPILYDWGVTWTSVIPVSIEITAPANISSWDLDPSIGENIQNGTLQVTVSGSSINWHVTVNDSDTVNTNGSMTEWYSGNSSYGTVKLETAMNVSGPSGEVTLPGGGTIAAGTGNNSSINITFKQYVTWDDEPGTYQIVVTFTAWLE